MLRLYHQYRLIESQDGALRKSWQANRKEIDDHNDPPRDSCSPNPHDVAAYDEEFTAVEHMAVRDDDARALSRTTVL
jgi:hypothetical protein